MFSNIIDKFYDPAFAEKAFGWLVTSGARILIIAAGAYVFMRIVNGAIGRFEKAVSGRRAGYASAVDTEKRVRTLTALLRSIVFVLVLGVAVVMVLKELGMDIAPIIAGAGILGLAVSFGAQNLVRDIISGFFIIFEDQVRVGDAAVINGKPGTVEEIKFRTIAIRDLDGTLHIFPNGSITQLSNQSRDWSRYIVDVRVAYGENLDYVIGTLREIGKGLAGDKNYESLILEPMDVLGVDSFGPSEVVVRCMLKTLPQKQWGAGRELRKRIISGLIDRGIEIPYQNVSVFPGRRDGTFGVRIEGGGGDAAAGA
ncbi:MAG: mechanosensitive ion channel family protein [Thermodesulfobacteriota bacterium]